MSWPPTEIVEQAPGTGFDAVVCASGSALTHAGILVGLRALGEQVPVLGICVRRDGASQGARVARVAAAMIECPDTFDAGDVDVSDAVRGAMAAGHEGLLLDRVDTGKAMAGWAALNEASRGSSHFSATAPTGTMRIRRVVERCCSETPWTSARMRWTSLR